MTAPHSTSLPPGKLLATHEWALSRGTNLVTNGTGYFGDNTNFSRFDYDPDDTPVGVRGAFIAGSAYSQTFIDEIVPVNPNNRYAISYMAKQKHELGGDVRHYSVVAPLDAFGNQISPYHYLHVVESITTLARTLKPGDTEIHLESADGWRDSEGGNSHRRTIQFWTYVDPGGKHWQPGTYTRYYVANVWDDGAIDRDTGIITLRQPWNSGTYEAGAPVSNGASGGQFIYPNTTTVPLEWTAFSGTVMAGVAPPGVLAALNTGWPYPTAAAQVGFLPNYQSGGLSRHSFAALEFGPVPDPSSQAIRSVPQNRIDPETGPSSSRPAAGSRVVGAQYFDTTIGRPIWWDGSKWINASGGTV